MHVPLYCQALKHVRKLDESLNEADSTLVATPHAQEVSPMCTLNAMTHKCSEHLNTMSK